MQWEQATSGKVARYAASREAQAAGFMVCGVSPRDPRWVRTVSPDNERGLLFRVGAGKWHWFGWDHEATGSGSSPVAALSGGLGDVIDTDAQLRSYEKQVLAAPQQYATECAGLYRAGVQAFNK